MILGETIRMAAGSLWGHKTRSLLTILGVVIGVGSVLGVVTLGKSFEASIIGQFDDVDNRAVFVTTQFKGSEGQGPPRSGNFGNVYTSYDAQEIGKLAHVERVVPSAELAVTGFVIDGKTLTYRQLTATTSQSSDLRNKTSTSLYASGGPFHDGKREIVIGDTIAHLLGNQTGRNMTAGQTMMVLLPDGTNQTVTIAGILAKSTSLFGSSNTQAYVPIDPFFTTSITSPRTGQKVLLFGGLTVFSDSARNTDAVRDATKTYLESKRSDASSLLSEQLQLTVATAGDITKQISAAFAQVTIFISAIAIVSLVVGAIGIANIMLVSVTERTREIGVMKAIGAKNGEILRLFLVESILIGIVGSILGIALGLGLGVLVVKGIFRSENIGVVYPLDFLAYSVLIGIGVGILAGYLPARRATKIQPIKALSYE